MTAISAGDALMAIFKTFPTYVVFQFTETLLIRHSIPDTWFATSYEWSWIANYLAQRVSMRITSGRISLKNDWCSYPLCSSSKFQIEERSDYPPPISEGRNLGISAFKSLRINLGNWNFNCLIAQCENFIVNIVLQFVCIKPSLPNIYSLIIKNLHPVRSKSVSNIGASNISTNSPNERIESTE